jgi:glutaredoxin-related protein
MNATASGIKLNDVLLLAGLQGRTGELTVESGNNIGTLVFHEGRILLAFSPYTRALGDLLVEQGVLTDAELLLVLKQQMTGPHTPVGTLLLKTGKVTFRTIENMVQEQIRKAVKDFSSWNPLEISFVRKDIVPFDSIHLPVYEFIPSDHVKSMLVFVAGIANILGPAGTVIPTGPAA